MNFNRYRLLILLLTIFSLLFSTAPSIAMETSPDILSRLKVSTAFAGEFQQTKILRDIPFPIISSGNFEFDTSIGLHWIIEKPIASQLLITPTEMVQTENNAEVFRVNSQKQPVAGLISKLFFAIFSGDIKLLKQHFRITEQPTIDESWSLQLIPINPVIANVIDRIELNGKIELNSFILSETSGDIIAVTISNRHNVSQPYADKD